MRMRVYKSLDRPYSFLGLKGSYIRYVIIGFVSDIPVSILVAKIAGGLVAVIFFAAVLFALYTVGMAFQAKYPDRDRKRWIASFGIPDFISFKPKDFRSYLKYDKDKR